MRIVVTILSVFLFHFAVAQSGKTTLFAKTTTLGKVKLKWFATSIYSDAEYFIERKNNGKWTRLNTESVTMGKTTVPTDETLKGLVDYANSEPFATTDGLMKLALFLKAVESQELARYFGMYFEDETAPNSKIDYRLVNAAGDVLAEVSTDGGKATLIEGPTGVKTEAGDAQVMLDISIESKRFYGYDLYRSTNPTTDFKKLNSTPLLASPYEIENHYYQDRGLENGTTYYYKFIGRDYFNEESESSTIVEVTPKDLTPPGSVRLLKATVNDQTVDLVWENNPKDKDLKGFEIYRRTNKTEFEKVSVELLSPTAITYKDETNEPGVYTYQVVAIDQSGNIGKGAETVAETKDKIAPETPTNVGAISEEGKITLTWEGNPPKDFLGYQVYRSATNQRGDKFSLLNAEPTKSTSIVDPLPSKAKNGFRYYVIALDTNLNKSAPTKIFVAKLPDVTPPVAPFIETITADGSEVQINWRSGGDLDVKSISLLRQSSGSTQWDTVGKFEPTTKQTTDVPNAGNWTYAMVETDSAGNISLLSDLHEIEIKDVHAAPAVTSVSVQIDTATSKIQIKVSWDAETTKSLRGFVVYRKSGTGTFMALSPLTTENSYIDTSVKSGTEYTYQVRSFSISGKMAISDETKLLVNE